jgi:hypothetical protein
MLKLDKSKALMFQKFHLEQVGKFEKSLNGYQGLFQRGGGVKRPVGEVTGHPYTWAEIKNV